MYQEGNLLTGQEFRELTGLRRDAREKFAELGFIHLKDPKIDNFYKPEDARLVQAMMAFLDEKSNLRTAYNKALAAMQAPAA